MAQRTRSDSATKFCTLEGCDRPLRARGVCSAHYKQLRREQTGRSHHRMYDRDCETCGTTWQTPRPDARFCTAKCKGVHLAVINLRKCALPDDHPVTQLIAEAKAARKPQPKPKPAYEWRTARECPGCACMFTPLHTPNAICCSVRCSRRVARRRRRAREVNALGSWVWSDFMRIARRFDYCCAYCGGKPVGMLDPDHVVPLSRGGQDSVTNLLPSCRQCNGDKRDLMLSEWALDRLARGKPPRLTAWDVEDRRFWHLTEANLMAAA